MSAEASWDALPLHLVHLILRNFEGHGFMRILAVMRLVSKSWHAAVREYPAVLGWSVDELEDVSELCALMPSMSGIQAISEQNEIDLQPLSACSQLTDVSLIGEPKMTSDVVYVDLSNVPLSVRSLAMNCVDFSGPTLSSDSSLNITNLDICDSQNDVEDVSSLLEDLPGLQVSRSLLHQAPAFALL